MSRLFVVRHAQASFFESDYDRVSDLGVEQAKLLGQHWARLGLSFDQVYIGPKRRHRQTWDGLVSGAGNHRLCQDAPFEMGNFDEYQIDAFLHNLEGTLPESCSQLLELWSDYRDADGASAKLATFHRLFQGLALAWRQGQVAAPEVESCSAFKKRVVDGITHLCANASRGSRVLLITSAGTSGMIFQSAVGCSDEKALEMGWVVRNTSVSEYLFSGERFSLKSFNSLPHISEGHLVTLR